MLHYVETKVTSINETLVLLVVTDFFSVYFGDGQGDKQTSLSLSLVISISVLLR